MYKYTQQNWQPPQFTRCAFFPLLFIYLLLKGKKQQQQKRIKDKPETINEWNGETYPVQHIHIVKHINVKCYLKKIPKKRRIQNKKKNHPERSGNWI